MSMHFAGFSLATFQSQTPSILSVGIAKLIEELDSPLSEYVIGQEAVSLPRQSIW